MATPLDVLAWLDSLHATTVDGAITNQKWPEAQEALAVVAELMAALDGAADRLSVVIESDDEDAIHGASPDDVAVLQRATAALAGAGFVA